MTGSLHSGDRKYSSPDWQMEFNVTLDWIHPNEIFVKHQLRAMIIRIQKMMAEIEMIKFRNRSLWDCRVYKNPLKEIVIDIEDPAEIEKLIAKDKKRRRDWHKPTLSYGRNYKEDSLENQNASDEQDAIRNINLNSVEPFQRSLGYDYKIEKDLLKSNDNTTSEININDCVDLKKRKNEKNNIIMSKPRRETSNEENPDLNVSDFKYKLKNNYRKENAFENNIEMKSKSSSSEELIPSDESELNQEDERTNKNWNWNINANVNTASNKHGNWEKFVEKISRTNINSHMDVNSDLSTKNSNPNRIPTFDSKSEEISLGNTEDEEASTKDNRTNWQTNFDVLKLENAEKNNETDLQCYCTSETNLINVERKDDNEILSSNESKESILEQLNSNETVTANKDSVELKKDDDLKKMNNKRIDTIYNLRDDLRFSATKTSPSTKDLPSEHLLTNKNVSVTENGNELIRPEHHREKTSTSAPQRFNKMDGNGTNVQNGSKIYKKQSNLMDVLLGGFDEILSTNISRASS
ncbi:hypothetical protein X777_06464 [Ooceraea biroi]|uniref:Uncharacterized protein n=1 Tax=Ooceraea biroi TaxID=2015173 RepID=A0A026WBP2_OOCBI|nr:hypothetical protein X777_06464 [Ooceraea biroi]